jgi:hypothetical protein
MRPREMTIAFASIMAPPIDQTLCRCQKASDATLLSSPIFSAIC